MPSGEASVRAVGAALVAAHAPTKDVEGCSGHPRAAPVGVRAYRDDSLK